MGRKSIRSSKIFLSIALLALTLNLWTDHSNLGTVSALKLNVHSAQKIYQTEEDETNVLEAMAYTENVAGFKDEALQAIEKLDKEEKKKLAEKNKRPLPTADELKK